MSKPVTCTMCGNMVDDADTVPMPNGLMCYDPCYLWLEDMMEQAEPDEDDDEYELVYYEEDVDD